MRKKMLFLVNPKAGHGDVRNNLMEILQIFTQGGYDVTVHPTSGPRDITQQIAQYGEAYDKIVSIGGDGTLNETVSGLMQLNHPPVLGYIPNGTVNDVASTLRIPKNPIEAAKTIVHGQEFTMDIGVFNDRWFAYVAAFGAFTDVSYRTPQGDKKILGRLAYLLQGVNRLTDMRPVHVRMWVDGQMIEDDVLFGMVASTTSVGGFKIKDELEISLNDGLSEVVLVRNIENLDDFNRVATALLKQDFRNPYFYLYKTNRVRFQFDKPVAWTLDGESGGEVKVAEVRNCHRALRIMVPGD